MLEIPIILAAKRESVKINGNSNKKLISMKHKLGFSDNTFVNRHAILKKDLLFPEYLVLRMRNHRLIMSNKRS